MMSKETLIWKAVLKQLVLIPIFATFTFAFITKNYAQETIKTDQTHIQEVKSSKNGVSDELLKEYENIITSNFKEVKGVKFISLDFNEADKSRLEEIFFQMSSEQQAGQNFVLTPKNSMYLKERIPDKEKFESLKDPKMYGVWINGKRVKNEALNNYADTDFATAYESRLRKSAINYGKHVYQVDLKTNEQYQAYYNNAIAQQGYSIVPNKKSK